MGELKGTGIHVAKLLLLWERGQTGEKEPPPIPIFTLKPPLSSSTPSFSLCQEAWLPANPVTNESNTLLLSSLHFSNNSQSLSPQLEERALPILHLSAISLTSFLSPYSFFFYICYKNISSKSNTKIHQQSLNISEYK